MSFSFKELDSRQTPLGLISLRKRAEPRLNNQILYEVKLGEEFLMSSLFTEAEEQLSTLGLAALAEAGFTEGLDIVVGGLGLGYTAEAALRSPAVKSLLVVDVMEAVIEWHQQGLVPLGKTLTSDTRCQLIHADFFKVATSKELGFDGSANNKKVHAVLLDIDHSPSWWLNPGNGDFYTLQALVDMKAKILPGGIFGLWSDESPDEPFLQLLASVFDSVQSHIVYFDNPYSGGQSTNTVYIAGIKK